jgi:hypothetical protein
MFSLCLHQPFSGNRSQQCPLLKSLLPDECPTTKFRVRVRVTLQLAVYRQSLRLGDKPLRLTTSNFVFQLNTCFHSPYVTSSLTRGWVCSLQLLLALARAVILRSESRGTHDHILLYRIQDSPNLEGQVPVFISPRNRVSQLYPQALGSLFVASYESQGYGGGIRRRLHMGDLIGWALNCVPLITPRHGLRRKHRSLL